jgi:hypothetical protein
MPMSRQVFGKRGGGPPGGELADADEGPFGGLDRYRGPNGDFVRVWREVTRP